MTREDMINELVEHFYETIDIKDLIRAEAADRQEQLEGLTTWQLNEEYNDVFEDKEET